MENKDYSKMISENGKNLLAVELFEVLFAKADCKDGKTRYFTETNYEVTEIVERAIKIQKQQMIAFAKDCIVIWTELESEDVPEMLYEKIYGK